MAPAQKGRYADDKTLRWSNARQIRTRYRGLARMISWVRHTS